MSMMKPKAPSLRVGEDSSSEDEGPVRAARNEPVKGVLPNEAPSLEERAPDGAPLRSGPKMGKREEYLPASYRLPNGNIRTDR